MNRQIVRRLKSSTARVECQPYDYLPRRRTPRLGGLGAPWALCQLSGTLNAATGSWPSITPTNATVSLYRPTNGALAEIASSVTLFNFRNVTWSAGKTTYCVPCGDGTWNIVDQDC